VKTIDSIKPTITKFPAGFARGCAAHDVLSAFASPADVLAALTPSSSATQAARDAITLALIAEHQRAPHALWQSLLLVAYEPMFASVKKRLRDKRDADARIVLTFLEAIAKVACVHPPGLLALDLRRSVERGVFGTGAAAREEPELVPLEKARGERSSEDPESRAIREEEKRLLLAELGAVFGDEAPEVLQVLVRARSGRESLVALVAELYPELTSKERAAAYDRRQRLRRRALLHFEERFGRDARALASTAA